MRRRRQVRALYQLYVAHCCRLHGLDERLFLARLALGKMRYRIPS